MWYTRLESTGIGRTYHTTPHHKARQEMAASKRPIHQVREQIKGKWGFSIWYSDSSNVQITSTPDYADSKGKIQLPMMMPWIQDTIKYLLFRRPDWYYFLFLSFRGSMSRVLNPAIRLVEGPWRTDTTEDPLFPQL